jgi:hypothetical protein
MCFREVTDKNFLNIICMSQRYGRIPTWGDIGLMAAVNKKKGRILKTAGK